MIRPRPAGPPPRLLAASAAASALLGALTLALLPTAPAAASGLVPATLARYLAQVPPAGARDVRVNNVYGSAHAGAWQFVAHLSWRTTTGTVDGGTTVLPERLGAPAGQTPLSPDQLAVEQRIGWPLPTLARVLAALPSAPTRLAYLEYAPVTGAPERVRFCAGSTTARCLLLDRTGTAVTTYATGLSDDPAEGPLAVSAS